MPQAVSNSIAGTQEDEKTTHPQRPHAPNQWSVGNRRKIDPQHGAEKNKEENQVEP
jgi:hypothetical protein